VAKRKELPPNLRARNEVTLVGALQVQASANHVPQNDTYVGRGKLEVGDIDVPLIAYGDVAKEMAEPLAGAVVKVTGRLVFHHWKTTLGDDRSRSEVEVKSLELLWTPKMLCGR
jgi:single-stranded DNA-binding protein